MRRIKDIVSCGLQDLRAHKKNNIISMLLIFASMITFIGVNSHVKTVNRSIEESITRYDGRICAAIINDNELEVLEEYFKDDERVVEVVKYEEFVWGHWLEAGEYIFTDVATIELFGFMSPILDYDYKGEKKSLKIDEIIVPRYLYDIGIYDEYTCGDGDELIGKTIKVRFATPEGMFDKVYELKVIGTYDNVKGGESGMHCYVNMDLLTELNDMVYEEEVKCQKEIEEMLKQEFGDEDASYEPSRLVSAAVYVNNDVDIDNLIKEVSETVNVYLTKRQEINPEALGYYNYVSAVGNMVSVMLLVIAVININISSFNEVKNRQWEFGLKMAMGYTKKDVIIIYLVEKLANMIKALVLAVFVVVIYCIVATYIIQNHLEYWQRAYSVMLDGQTVVIGMVIVVLAAMLGTFIGSMAIKKIDVTKVLRTEE